MRLNENSGSENENGGSEPEGQKGFVREEKFGGRAYM
jgi:hypothetical protein